MVRILEEKVKHADEEAKLFNENSKSLDEKLSDNHTATISSGSGYNGEDDDDHHDRDLPLQKSPEISEEFKMSVFRFYSLVPFFLRLVMEVWEV